MAKYRITALYEYGGVFEADSPEEAEAQMLQDLNSHYISTESMEIEEIEEEEEDED